MKVKVEQKHKRRLAFVVRDDVYERWHGRYDLEALEKEIKKAEEQEAQIHCGRQEQFGSEKNECMYCEHKGTEKELKDHELWCKASIKK